ncbi:2767_t:CDS:2 [Ambispora gerdemannii]|uniref:2767_t:CDS:1 n=1 Tax=Ambispora gerdemannii TaxID=144530 RepID=A0A9N8VU00_9GLOM|nr:2767_t:CDS:2 [Ambispora gerdemannii]
MGLSKEMFIDSVPDGYMCAICLDVLQEPTFVECVQEHAFCRSCINELIKSSHGRLSSPSGTISCPTCRERVNTSSLRVSKFVKRLIGSLNVRCANKECDWVGSCMDQGWHETMMLPFHVQAKDAVVKLSEDIWVNILKIAQLESKAALSCDGILNIIFWADIESYGIITAVEEEEF